MVGRTGFDPGTLGSKEGARRCHGSLPFADFGFHLHRCSHRFRGDLPGFVVQKVVRDFVVFAPTRFTGTVFGLSIDS
jgi:hypothetical protein